MLKCRLSTCVSLLAVSAAWAADPPPFCELYAPSHFGNWYEVAGEREMRAMLAEARHWGFTRYGDWFDTIDCADPFSGNPQYALGNALRDRKKANYRTAQALGLETDLLITPNHVYRDQLKPEWLAEGGGRVFGQIICPHKTGARAAIVENQRKLLSDLAKAGVRLNALTACPYDYGGCNCDACKPWILTFADLTFEIYKVAQAVHPGIELHFVGWWWNAEEHKQFAEWMDRNAPGTAASISLHIPYDKTGVADVPLPRGCRRFAFVHIGYADDASPRDVYGKTGPVIAARRLEKTVANLRAQSVTGVVAYSEGICDDVNKAILAGLFSGKYASSDDILRAYAKRYFAADEQQAAAWTEWLVPWGKPFVRDASEARQRLASLSGNASDWRRRQWELKTEMFIANRAIGTGKDWPAARLAQVEAFWAAWERLQREVYGIGPLRHVLAPAYLDLPWYKSWAQHQAATATAPAVPLTERE